MPNRNRSSDPRYRGERANKRERTRTFTFEWKTFLLRRNCTADTGRRQLRSSFGAHARLFPLSRAAAETDRALGGGGGARVAEDPRLPFPIEIARPDDEEPHDFPERRSETCNLFSFGFRIETGANFGSRAAPLVGPDERPRGEAPPQTFCRSPLSFRTEEAFPEALWRSGRGAPRRRGGARRRETVGGVRTRDATPRDVLDGDAGLERKCANLCGGNEGCSR